MMDARPLYPEGHHPVRRNYTPDSMHRISPLSRSDRPVRYYYIDFGLSVQFPPGVSPYVLGDVGRDAEVPELSEVIPYDAYKADIYALGNLFYKEFHEVCPSPSHLPLCCGLTTAAAIQQHGVHDRPARAHEATPA